MGKRIPEQGQAIADAHRNICQRLLRTDTLNVIEVNEPKNLAWAPIGIGDALKPRAKARSALGDPHHFLATNSNLARAEGTKAHQRAPRRRQETPAVNLRFKSHCLQCGGPCFTQPMRSLTDIVGPSEIARR